MNFKDILENDIQNIFLNLEEFGETHNLNGTDVICVTDEDSFQEKEISGKLTIESGFYKEGITVFIDKKYLKRIAATKKEKRSNEDTTGFYQ